MKQLVNFPQLALLTLRNPVAAAEVVLSWNIPKEALWTAIALVSVVATMLSTLSNMMFPVPAPLNGIVGNPFIYFLVVVGLFIATSHAVFWTGRMFGGSGRIENLMALLLWLQAMRVAAQLAVLLCLMLIPVLASILVLFVAVATLWVLVHFISVGLQLHSVVRAVIVLIVGATALVVGLSFLLSLVGISAIGVPLNV